MLRSSVVRCEYLRASRARVSHSFPMYAELVAHSRRSGVEYLLAFAAWEAADFVGLHMRSKPRLGDERLAARLAHVVLVVRVHVLVQFGKVREFDEALLTGEAFCVV